MNFYHLTAQAQRDLQLFWHLMKKQADHVMNKFAVLQKKEKFGKCAAINFHEQFTNVTNYKYLAESYGII